MKTNRLIDEKSPYLLQHSHNPVDWYPWGEEAFERARREDKPVFLSIGYSTCHWCHVMAHESFEDESVSALMNSAFISVKVDREERPDIDNIYMEVCHILTGSGGWPLTIIMTPDKRPFFAGTYFPKETRHGRIGMMDLIQRIQDVWVKRRGEVMDSADKILLTLKNMEGPPSGPDVDVSVLDKAYQDLSHIYDDAYGGFGKAPKFPSPQNLLFLLRYWNRTGIRGALNMVEQTIRSIRRGGIYDQVGFGLHRYSTDREWLVPHFEKMLYDQALFALACLETKQATGSEFYALVAGEVLTYVVRDMTSQEGGFCSAEDADSEGEEGKFYLWDNKEVLEILGKSDGEFLSRVFEVKEDGNFRDEAPEQSSGYNILHLKMSHEKKADDLGITLAQFEGKIASLCVKLFEARQKRVRPSRDDKVLTDWNGLMIAALARGAQVLEDRVYLEAAVKSADFILSHLIEKNGGLLHRYRDGEAGIPGHLDDYAFLVWGLIELYEACFDAEYLEAALNLNEEMIGRFMDVDKGGLFFTASDTETLLFRKKEAHDTAVPSGNSVAMLNLLRLARLTGRAELEETAGKVGRAFSERIRYMPSAYAFLLTAVDFALGPSYEVVVSGNFGSPDTIRMISALRQRFIPGLTVILHPVGDPSSPIEKLAGFVKGYSAIGDKATAYVCHKNSCNKPTTDPFEMLRLLDGGPNQLQQEEPFA